MTFQISIGFSGLENPDGKDEQSKNYALFLGDTVVVNEVIRQCWCMEPSSSRLQNEPCSLYTSSKKDISHIAIILKDDGAQDEDVAETPAIAPRRAAATEKGRLRI